MELPVCLVVQELSKRTRHPRHRESEGDGVWYAKLLIGRENRPTHTKTY